MIDVIKEYKEGRRDFSTMDFTDITVTGTDLLEVDFTGADLTDVIIDGHILK